jgi:hypothetical protein
MTRIIVRIELTPAAKAGYAKVADRYGQTQIATTSRLIEWFAGQSEGVQAAVLGQYPKEIEADVARLLLETHKKAGDQPAKG